MQLGTCRWRAQLINPWTASRQATAQLAMCRRAVLACAGRGVALAAAPTPAPGPAAAFDRAKAKGGGAPPRHGPKPGRGAPGVVTSGDVNDLLVRVRARARTCL